ncbi:MAG: FAD-dependent oxidoreductase [Clostridiales bacterium]|nr:FAD-dependent oxidoreductase [Clostridiales bacterium]
MSLDFSLSFSTEDKGNKLDPATVYDTIIIGGGPAGLNAALYAKRKGMNIGIIANRIGGQVLDTSSVENYLGFNSLSGEELMQKFEKHVKEYKVATTTDVLVKSITNGNIKKINVSNGKIYQTKSIIIATGSKPRMLNVPGEKEYLGKGVAYCAICDGPLFAGKDVIITGGGNSAVEAAIDIAKIANTVKLVHRSEFRADKVLVEKLYSLKNVEIYLQTQIQEIYGEMLMTHITALDKKENKEITINADGLFVEIGYLPKSEIFEGLVEMNEKKEIIVNNKAETSAKGIYASGDVTDVPYKQIIISTADGAKAALSANDYVNKLK